MELAGMEAAVPSHPIPSHRRPRERGGMAAVAGAGAGGGEEMLRPRPRPRRQRVPLADLTNLSPATSVVARLLKPKPKPKPKAKRTSADSSIVSSTVPRIPTPPPPPPATLSVSVSGRKSVCTTPKGKIGGVLPGPSSPPRKKTRKVTGREKQPRTMEEPLISPLYPSSKTKARSGDGLSGSSFPSSKKTRKVTSGGSSSRGREEEQTDIMEEMSCDEEYPVPSQEFIEERTAYFAEIDACELVEEFVSSGSEAE